MRDVAKGVICIIAVCLFFMCLVGSCTGACTMLSNKIDYVNQKVDDATNYETLKKVEDTCRAMISSYESDRMAYEQYKDSDNEEKQSWAEQAKMRANKTASTYNNYILENSFVWSGNVPKDIKTELEYIE